ncbi:hypothetical protein [Aeromicrobium sp. REDSEA-S38_B2]|uniref:hypothetical protein n=1 Tax=Aeromicrobium sp. REDSEA-S38_B2 TaxID=1811528 RepID=UPI00257F0855|nr:hypothetical protein [Aeromicrobium sp. REDSEA-S38_B2]
MAGRQPGQRGAVEVGADVDEHGARTPGRPDGPGPHDGDALEQQPRRTGVGRDGVAVG